MGYPIRPSNVRVYQFRHTCSENYYSEKSFELKEIEIDAHTRKPFNPVDLISDDKIEMTQWELQDFAVQVVRNYISDQGFEIMSFNSAPEAHPSIWFVRDKQQVRRGCQSTF